MYGEFRISMPEELSLESHLQSLLNRRLRVTGADRHLFRPGIVALDKVVSTHRIILLEKGSLEYTVEGVTAVLKPGDMVFVPAWVRRSSRLRKGSGVLLTWCEFRAEEMDIALASLYLRRSFDARLEKESFQRLIALWKTHGCDHSEKALLGVLQMEGELKARLARFWVHAQLPSENLRQEVSRHIAVQKALQWLAANYQLPEADQEVARQGALRPEYFRSVFRQQTGLTLKKYITALRLRRARWLLHNSSLSVKQIAFEMGYEDPLYFSRLYHTFWSVSPQRERETVGGNAPV